MEVSATFRRRRFGNRIAMLNGQRRQIIRHRRTRNLLHRPSDPEGRGVYISKSKLTPLGSSVQVPIGPVGAKQWRRQSECKLAVDFFMTFSHGKVIQYQIRLLKSKRH
jgi:hypothetical protein